MKWELSDVEYGEGAILAFEKINTTLAIIQFEHKIPKFTIERKELLDKYIDLTAHKDINYKVYPNYPKNFSVKVESTEEMDKFHTPELKVFLIDSNIPNIESNGSAILLFPSHFRLAKAYQYAQIIKFMNKLRKQICNNK